MSELLSVHRDLRFDTLQIRLRRPARAYKETQCQHKQHPDHSLDRLQAPFRKRLDKASGSKLTP
jgi:hypothetical protein